MSVERLNFRHLFYFWRVARTGHLTRAAQELHTSQSALSAQIRQLEERLGEALFEREGRDFPRFYAAVRDLAALPKAERQATLAALTPGR